MGKFSALMEIFYKACLEHYYSYKVITGLVWNCISGQGTAGYILGMIWITIWIQDPDCSSTVMMVVIYWKKMWFSHKFTLPIEVGKFRAEIEKVHILWNSMTLTSFIFTELANTMKYGEGSYITFVSPSAVTVFHRIIYFGHYCPM